MSAGNAVASRAGAELRFYHSKPSFPAGAAGMTLHVAGRTHPVELTGAGPWAIGRAEAADVSFPDDPFCSRAQAIIRTIGGGFYIEPISQNTPTRLNNQLLPGPQALERGDVIVFGKQTITVGCAGAGAGDGGKTKKRLENSTASGAISIVDQLMVRRRDSSQIGAGQQNGVDLDHPTVSRRHARFLVRGGKILIEDLGSTNGTWVNGVRISSPSELKKGARISIGTFVLVFDGAAITIRTRKEGASLRALEIYKDVTAKGKGAQLRLLDNVSLELPPGELVCIIGASGSGKSTLMNIISGRNPPSRGHVRLGEFDMHACFEMLKQDVAYVPQSDILHEFLSLRQGLDYAARLRLPSDTDSSMRERLVRDAAASVGLEHRLDVRVASLSGGQKKRASLATELLAKPQLMFLDEVTSGLDENTDREVMQLLKRLADRGMTVVCVTHTLANLEDFADTVVVMGQGGLLTFRGSPAELRRFFDVGRLGQAFSALDATGAAAWRDRFAQIASPVSFQPSRTVAPEPQRRSTGERFDAGRSQFGILTSRNIALALGDRRTLLMAVIQSVAVGVLLGFAYRDFGAGFARDNSRMSFLLVLGITCLWIGCAGAAKDIVGELPIYLRERDINLSTPAFVLSKFLVSCIFAIIQVAILLLSCALLAQEIPGKPLEQFALACLAAFNGVAVGLLISSLSNSRDQAAVIVPLALAPQLIFGSGLVANLSAAGQWLAKLVVGAYWTREAMNAALLTVHPGIRQLDPVTGGPVPVAGPALPDSIAALTAQTLVWVLLTIGIMVWRYSRKARASR